MCKKKPTKLQTQNRNVTVTLQACTRPEKTYFSSEWYLPRRSHWDSRCRNRHSISQKPDLLIQECRIFKREGQSATTWKFFVTEREKCSGGSKWACWNDICDCCCGSNQPFTQPPNRSDYPMIPDALHFPGCRFALWSGKGLGNKWYQ